MGRDYPRSGLYASLRWEVAGEPTNVLIDSLAFRTKRRRIILLLHGYNVSCKAGHKTLKRFENQLRKYSATLANDIAWLMWPGDWRIPLVSGASYPFKVLKTPRLGEKIARFLHSLGDPNTHRPEIIIVAHSLGCRVTLEALRELDLLEELASLNMPRKPEVQIYHPNISILLMAAAVPVNDLKPGAYLHDAALRATRRAVLYSNWDIVLQLAFRLGQGITPGESGMSEAVGTAGRPTEIWTDGDRMAGYGHGSYWKKSETAAWLVRWLNHAAPLPLKRRILPRRSILKRKPASARSLLDRNVF